MAPRRLSLRLTWAIASTAVAATAFLVLFLASSEIPALRAQSPWQDDPWDAVMSVAFLFVPVVAAVTAVRVVRLALDPRPGGATIRLVLRGLLVAVGLVAVAVAMCLVAYLGRVHAAEWGRDTGALVALAAVTALLVAPASALLVLAWREGASARPDGASRDLVSDLLATVALAVGQGSPAADELRRLDARLDVVSWSPRRHVVLAGAAIAIVFGTALSTWHLIAEGGPPPGHLLSAWVLYALIAAGICFAGWMALRPALRLLDATPRRRR